MAFKPATSCVSFILYLPGKGNKPYTHCKEPVGLSGPATDVDGYCDLSDPLSKTTMPSGLEYHPVPRDP